MVFHWELVQYRFHHGSSKDPRTGISSQTLILKHLSLSRALAIAAPEGPAPITAIDFGIMKMNHGKRAKKCANTINIIHRAYFR